MSKSRNSAINKANRYFALLFLVMLVSIASLSGLGASQPDKGTIEVQILAINDLHGQLEPPISKMVIDYNETGAPIRVDAGGSEYLATHIKELRSENPNTFVISAGDNIGASPIISSRFHDEPTIKALNIIGLNFSAVGNHELDNGLNELMRIQNGGCHPTDGCLNNSSFEGAHFQYLAANIVNESTNATIFPAYKITCVQGVPIGFIGVALKDTPSIVTPSRVKGLKFLDEAETINKYAKELKHMGVKTIVVIIHDGGYQEGLYNESLNMSGPIVDVVNATDPEVDAFITGHTHQAYNANIDGRIVTQADSAGNLLTDIDLVISNKTHDVIEERSRNIIVSRDVPKDSEVTELVNEYNSQIAALANRVIGNITSDITVVMSDSGESALGDLIADAQLYATSDPSNGGAVVAFANPGGIRADLIYTQQSGNELPGQITYGEAFSVQPSEISLVTMTLNGTQIDTLLEQQIDNPTPRILQISKGFSYTWNESAPMGNMINISSIKINGTSINPSSPYRVTVNNRMADGSYNLFVLKEGVNRTEGPLVRDALVNYFAAFSPVTPEPMNRIAVVR
ncbi:bifunctional metallophosphatase/5'-nucleotidase [Methanosarcina sp. UBA5]|uniref:bifunctional metallophosphatase/5'-nucleotidase n=1 Tax=Methanosarcina sp. UBA5 TaxID=1915593 RepID=UPI0025D9526C|nr:bifunctional metallophosphatase/5'-nucleotidase [Methanosarcina sp. UBA5]